MYILVVLLVIFIIMKTVAVIKREASNVDDENPYLHPERAEKILPAEMAMWVNTPSTDSISDKGKTLNKIRNRSGAYEHFLKPLIDVILSFLGLLVLSPVFLAITIAIKLDDPGSVFFMQKRVEADDLFVG